MAEAPQTINRDMTGLSLDNKLNNTATTKADVKIGEDRGNFGDGSNAIGRQFEANTAQANLRIQQQQANNAINSEALARQMRNNTAQSNAQVTNAGLAGQGAGNAMQGQTAQNNAQLASNMMLQQNQADADAQMDAARMTQEAQRFAQEQTQWDKDRVNELWNMHQQLLESGDLAAADKFARENNLGDLAGQRSSVAHFERKMEHLDSENARLQGVMDNAKTPAEYVNAQRNLQFNQSIQQQMRDAAAQGHNFFQVQYETLTQPEAWRNPNNPNEEPQAWSQQEWQAFQNVRNQLGIMENDPRMVDVGQDIMNILLAQGNYKDQDDFWNRAPLEQIERMSQLLWDVNNGFGENGDQAAEARVRAFLAG